MPIVSPAAVNALAAANNAAPANAAACSSSGASPVKETAATPPIQQTFIISTVPFPHASIPPVEEETATSPSPATILAAATFMASNIRKISLFVVL